MTAPRVAIVCDWLTNMGGAERVVLALHKAFPNAPIYTSVFTPETMPAFSGLDIRTTYLQKLPVNVRGKHQLFPLQRHNAFRALDLREYDVIISATSAEAKAVLKRPDAIHICYCFTPTRYYWSHYRDYIAEPGFGALNPAMRVLLPVLVRKMRKLDLRAASGVDYFVTISNAIADRVKKYYGRESEVIFPPVDMQRFNSLKIDGKREGYIAFGRQVAYKRYDIAIEACNALKLPLTVYGSGPDHKRLERMAGPTVRFVQGASDKQIAHALSKAQAYLFPQEEDFGITQVEALAAGCPVIAYSKGGALDVITKQTGIFFDQQNADSLIKALKKFKPTTYKPDVLQAHARDFSEEVFIAAMQKFVAEHTTKQ